MRSTQTVHLQKGHINTLTSKKTSVASIIN